MVLKCGGMPTTWPLVLPYSLTSWMSLPLQHRSHGANVRRLALNVEVILVSQLVGVSGAHVSGDGWGTTGEHEHDVFAQRIHFLSVARAETFAQSNQQEQRTHSPCDPEHGEEGAQLVRPQGAQHLPKDFEKDHLEAHSPLLLSLVR